MCRFVSIVSSVGQVFISVNSVSKGRVRVGGEGHNVSTGEGQSQL